MASAAAILKQMLSGQVSIRQAGLGRWTRRHAVREILPSFFQAVFVLEVMAGLQPYRFEPERACSYPEDSESEDEEVNDRL